MPVEKGGSPLFKIRPISKHHKRVGFSYGVEVLDRYLKTQARQDMLNDAGVCMVAVTDEDAVIAYYTLSNSIIRAGELDVIEARRLPKYPELPATLLGRLAVDLRFKGRGIGEHMLLHALKRALKSSVLTGSYVVMVDAKNNAAAAFYQRYGFNPITDRPDRLKLPMKKIPELFRKSHQ